MVLLDDYPSTSICQSKTHREIRNSSMNKCMYKNNNYFIKNYNTSYYQIQILLQRLKQLILICSTKKTVKK